MFFHASKHPHKSANGVLLGSSSSDGSVEIEDSIPLLHHWTSLSPMMEVGLDLARGHAESLGLQLVGYYQACQRLDDTALAPVGEKVAETIRAKFTDAIAFVIDGPKLGSGKPALIPYLSQPTSTSWRPHPSGSDAFSSTSRFKLASEDSPLRAVALVHDDLHQKFGDFDDHLEDVRIDWLQNKSCLQGA